MSLIKNGEVVYERDFSEERNALSPEEHENFLIRQGAVFADEYLYDDLSDSEQLKS